MTRAFTVGEYLLYSGDYFKTNYVLQARPAAAIKKKKKSFDSVMINPRVALSVYNLQGQTSATLPGNQIKESMLF